MKQKIFLLIFIVVFSHFSEAQNNPGLVSYQEIQRMSPAVRAKYLEGVREIVEELEQKGVILMSPSSTNHGQQKSSMLKNTILEMISKNQTAQAAMINNCSCSSELYESDTNYQSSVLTCIQKPKTPCAPGTHLEADEKSCSGAVKCPGAINSDGHLTLYRRGCAGRCVPDENTNTLSGEDPVEKGKRDPRGLESRGRSGDPSNSNKSKEKKEDVMKCMPVKCDPEDSELRFRVKSDFNQRVIEKSDKRCINGGMIGQYNIEGNKKCRAIRQKRIGSFNLTCSASQTMCNPMLYGLANENPPKALCVPIAVEVTKACHEVGSIENAQKFWQRSDLVTEDLEEQWDNLRAAIEKDLCSEKRSAEYHCQECFYIYKRLSELNKLAGSCVGKCGDLSRCTIQQGVESNPGSSGTQQ